MAEILIPPNDAFTQHVMIGGETSIPYDFPIFSDNDIVVLKQATAAAAASTLVKGAGYTVTGVGELAGGNIELTTAAILNEVYTVYRDTAIERQTDYDARGDLPPATLNLDFDRIVTMMQEMDTLLKRSMRQPFEDLTPFPPLPKKADRLNKIFAGDLNGNPVMLDLPTADAGITSVTATGSTTAISLADRFRLVWNVRDYGAVGDGVTDDRAAIQACYDACKAFGGGTIKFPAGIYLVGAPLRIFGGVGSQTLRFEGDGSRNTTILAGANFDSIFLLEGGAYGDTTVSGGAVTAGTIVWGGHYASVPLVTITDLDASSPGSGATATADGLDADGRVTGVTINTAGTGYNAATTKITFDVPPTTHLALQIEIEHLSTDSSTFVTSGIHAPPGSDQHQFQSCRFVGSGAVSLVKTWANFLQYHYCNTNAQGFNTVGLDIMGRSIDGMFTDSRIGGRGRGIRIRNDYGINSHRPQGTTFTDFHVFTTGKYTIHATDCIFINFNGSWLVEAARKQDVGQVWQVDASGGPSFSDETTDANDAGNNDVNLFPATPAIGDYCVFGYEEPFEQLSFDNANGTQGVGGVMVWEYWNGSWTALSSVIDNTSHFNNAKLDEVVVHWAIPTDWAASVINGSSSLYYVRARATTKHSTVPVYDEVNVHEGKERVLLGSGCNQFAFGAGTYFGGTSPVIAVNILSLNMNTHKFNGVFFNGGRIGIQVEFASSVPLSELLVNGCTAQDISESFLDMDSVQNAVITGNVDRSSAARAGSWVTRGSHSNKGHYSFANNNWHTVAPTVFESGATYDFNGDTGIVGNSHVSAAFSSLAAKAISHTLFAQPTKMLLTIEAALDLGAPRVTAKTTTTVTGTWPTSGSGTLHLRAEV